MTDAAWISGYPWQDEPVGGIFYQTQARALVRLGIAVTVLCPTPWAPWPLSQLRRRWRNHAQAPRVAVDEGVTVVRPRFPNIPGQPSRAVPDRFIAGAVWRSRRHWADARLVHSHGSFEGLAAWRLSQRTGLPFVMTFHGDDMNTWPHDYPDRIPDIRAAARAAAAVIAVSGALAGRIQDVTGVDATALPIGSDHHALATAALPRADARRLLSLPHDRVIALFVGNMLKTKGVRELAEAILGLGDPFLGVFVGAGPDLGFGLEDPRANGRLTYVGERPHIEVAQYLSAADVLVLPSYGEGLPTVLVEAGSLGVPVIASSVGGIPELLGSDRGTILSSVSTGAVAAALVAFSVAQDEARSAADRLRMHVRELYDVDRNAARIKDLYLDLSPGLRREHS